MVEARTLALAAAAIAAGLYALPMVGLLALEPSIVFPAPRTERAVLDARAAATGAETFFVETSDGERLYGWHRSAGHGKALLYAHGNAEAVDRTDLHDAAVAQGFDVVVVAYRGYPGSSGAPSEQGLALDLEAAWGHVTEVLGIPPSRVVLHGKSLGGGVASGLAMKVHPAALVLESTYTSVPDVAAARYWFYPVRWLMRSHFPTAERAPSLTLPVLVMHGSSDTVIPVSHGRVLSKAFPNVTYVEVAGAHHSETFVTNYREASTAWTALLQRAVP